MRKASLLALALATVLTSQAHSLELKHVRAAFGPLGATRPDAKFLPGDNLILVFEIEGLKVNPTSGIATYEQAMDVIDSKGTTVFGQKSGDMKVPLFGGSRLPSSAVVVLTEGQGAGRYKVKVSVTDKLAKASKEVTYDFELGKKAFGIVLPFTPAVSFVGQDIVINFAVVGMARNAKTKMPDVECTTRLLDDSGKPTIPNPVTVNVQDLHDPDKFFDVTKLEVIPVGLPIVLTRDGKFTIEIQVHDKLAKEQRWLRLPLHVIDPVPLIGKATTGSGQ